MKKTLIRHFYCLVAGAFLLVSCESNTQMAVNKQSVNMKVEGMVCALGCAKYIEDQVAELNGVMNSEVIFEDGVAKFEFDGNVISSKELENFIDDIHNGQYEAEIIADTKEETERDSESVQEGEEEVVAVSEKFQISFPQLLGYFLKSLR